MDEIAQAYLAGKRRGLDFDTPHHFVVKGENAWGQSVQLHFDDGKGVAGGEVPLGVPHGSRGLHLVCG